MILEQSQILSTASRLSGLDQGYKITHKNHPCTIWCSKSIQNWLWLKQFTLELGKEYTFRYDKVHKSIGVTNSLFIPDLPDIGMTTFAKAMPFKYKTKDVVESYRAYYIGEKQHIAEWKNRDVPEWFRSNISK